MKQGRSIAEIDQMDMVWYLQLLDYASDKKEKENERPIDQIPGL